MQMCNHGKMVEDADDVLEQVGPRLRSLRQHRALPLTVLAEATGISTSTLSRLENGRLRPTLEQLLPLARTHGVTLDELVGAPPTGDPRVHLRPVRHQDRTFLPLTRRPGGIQAYKLIIAGRRTPCRPELQTHAGYEWLYVLNGQLRLLLGEQDLILGPGEAAEFDTRSPHWIGSAEGEAVELLILFGPQGERAHMPAVG
jgi:transcriptional regulator with XRE-family HTH domain